MSGYNTDWYLKYLSTSEGKYDVFESMTTVHGVNEEGISDVKLVTIFFGANDASCKEKNPRHHVPVEKFRSNLKTLVSLCREYFGKRVRIILITPPPVHHASRLKYQVKRYGDKATGILERNMDLASKYADAVVGIAKELGLPYLNVFKDMQDAAPGEGEEWGKFLSDGLHLSREGNMFVGEALKALVDEVFPEISVEPCPSTGNPANGFSKAGSALGSDEGKGIGPWHSDINHLDPDKAFESN